MDGRRAEHFFPFPQFLGYHLDDHGKRFEHEDGREEREKKSVEWFLEKVEKAIEEGMAVRTAVPQTEPKAAEEKVEAKINEK
jgi:fatty acid-binding protein DegV